MVKLRLTRLGRKKKPVYRIAAMEELTQRRGSFKILTKRSTANKNCKEYPY